MEEKIALNIREIYGSADLDAVHIFAMKAAMQVQREGFYGLEAPAGTLADPDADGFLRLAVRLVADSRMPETIDVILNAEREVLVQKKFTPRQLLVLNAIPMLIPELVQRRGLAALRTFEDLWGMDVNAYSQNVFYPTLTKEELDAVGWVDMDLSPARFIPFELEVEPSDEH